MALQQQLLTLKKMKSKATIETLKKITNFLTSYIREHLGRLIGTSRVGHPQNKFHARFC
jgi:hypothetical protein